MMLAGAPQATTHAQLSSACRACRLQRTTASSSLSVASCAAAFLSKTESPKAEPPPPNREATSLLPEPPATAAPGCEDASRARAAADLALAALRGRCDAVPPPPPLDVASAGAGASRRSVAAAPPLLAPPAGVQKRRQALPSLAAAAGVGRRRASRRLGPKHPKHPALMSSSVRSEAWTAASASPRDAAALLRASAWEPSSLSVAQATSRASCAIFSARAAAAVDAPAVACAAASSCCCPLALQAESGVSLLCTYRASATCAAAARRAPGAAGRRRAAASFARSKGSRVLADVPLRLNEAPAARSRRRAHRRCCRDVVVSDSLRRAGRSAVRKMRC